MEDKYTVTNTIWEGQEFHSKMKRIEFQEEGPLQIVDSKHGIPGYKHSWQLFDEDGGSVIKIDYMGHEHMMAVDVTILSENESQRDIALASIERLTEIKLLTLVPQKK